MNLPSVQAKGIAGLVARAGTIVSRFGPTPERMNRCLERYVKIAEESGIQPTLAVTAAVLARHPGLLRGLYDRGTELAIHGLVHVDYKPLSLDEQRWSIARAGEIFRQAGIRYTGFRAPYLRFSPATDEALRLLGIQYHSSQAIAFPLAFQRNGAAATFRRVLDYYQAIGAGVVAVRPRAERGLIQIPVALPDDEIMVDRLRLDGAAQFTTWVSILDAAHRGGDLFTVQLHPERIFQTEDALRSILAEAHRREPPVWLAPLREIAAWWLQRGGFHLEVAHLAGNRYRVRLDAGPDATLLLRGLPSVSARPWYGQDSVTALRDFEVVTARKPVVGVSKRTPGEVLGFLREEGLLTETSDDPSGFGAYVDVAGPECQERTILQGIEQAPGPLVRIWRWPRGARSALALTGDIDSLTLQDFVARLYDRSGPGRARAMRASCSPTP